ncbi:type II toxin-antitoxin system VapC family toxin [Sandarakinorhabdus sp.]|uniref:type II toxin-antitoxin system VapC family toxin n=1 Tax=Sandarakinorhabdus sp. TaxID=1916663 RepID=UPI003F72098D
MIVDSSALLAILLGEPEARSFADIILAAKQRSLPASAYVEISLKLDRGRRLDADPVLDQTLTGLGLAIEPLTAMQARLARQAFNRFGNGNGNGGPLNFGDCLVYATARHLNLPLLFKGNDFAQTDVTPALPAGEIA